MKRILLSILFVLNFVGSLLAQCPVTATANATPDVICSPGGTVNLSGTNNATTLFEEFWTASVGSVNDPNSPNTTANISVPTTFTYTARACDNTNLIVNGDFEAGNTGFTSLFTFSTSFFPTPCEYYITDDPSLFGFPNCVDKTPGSGVNMQLVDALGIQDKNAWCQTVAVNPTSDYKFTFWGLALVLGTTLEAKINGTPIGSTVIPAPLFGVCDWRKVEQTWVNPGTSTAEICITNITSSVFSIFPPSLASPVYALDEISFVELCTDSDDIFVDVLVTDAVIGKPTPSIDCSGNSVTLDGSASSSGTNISYQWTTSGGNIIGSTTNNTADVDEAGDYTLTVTYDDGTTICSDSETVTVEDQSVEAIIIGPSSVDCSGNIITLDGSSSTGNITSYEWTTVGGTLPSNTSTPSIDINQPGDYTLTVENNSVSPPCSHSETVTITSSEVEAIVIAPPSVDCDGNNITLDGSGSTGNITSYEWTTVGGALPSNTSTPSIDINQPGDYTLTIENNSVSPPCSHSQTVTISSSGVQAIVTGPLIIDCDGNNITLDGSGSTGNITSYEWTTVGGVLPANTSTPSIDVNEPGDYTLTVTDNSTSPPCTDFETITITSSEVEAIVIAPSSVDCDGNNITLDGSGSTGNITSYEWTTVGGVLPANTSTPSIDVNEPGDYTLTVTDNSTSPPCTDFETITITSSEVEAIVIAPSSVDCDGNNITLDGSGSTGNITSYEWTTTGGTLPSNTSTPSIDVNQPGDYTLTVENNSVSPPCSHSHTVTISSSGVEAIVTGPLIIDCDGNNITLDGSGSTGNITSYEWTTVGGVLPANTSTPSIDVNEPGDYTLTVMDNTVSPPCTDSETITITSSEVEAIVIAPSSVDCDGNNITLDGSGSTGNITSYEWTTVGGTLPSNTSTPSIDINQPGDYTLTVENNSVSPPCSHSQTVTISSSGVEAIVTGPLIIDCDGNNITLDGSGSTGNITSYEWTTLGGTLPSNTSTPSIDVNEPGDYTLTVMDNSVSPPCTDSETITITSSEVEAIVINPQSIDCDGNAITIDGSGSTSGPDVFYSWSTPDGNIVGSTFGNTIIVDEGGEYILTVTYDDGTIICTDTENIFVTEIEIESIIAIPELIDCDNNPITLDGSASSSGSNISYTWTTSNGNIIGSFLGNTISVNMAGDYTLTVTYDDGTTNCSVSETVTVIEIEVEAVIAFPEVIDCDDNPIFIDGSGSTSGINITYEWTTLDGNIIGSTNGDEIEVDSEGEYILTVTYDDGNIICSDVESVLVTEIELDAIIDTPPVIDCNGTPIVIDGSNSTSGSDIFYSWTTPDGNIIGSTNGNTIDVDKDGEYYLTVTYDDGVTTCSETESVVVSQVMISVDVNSPDLIDCDNNPITIDGSGSSSGANIFYEWTTTNGNIISSNTGNSIDVDQGGDYTLTVTYDDGTTICKESETVTVEEIEVEAIIDTPPFIDCDNNPIILDGFGSSTGAGYTYEWTTTNGNILGSNTGIDIDVDMTGDYTLTVRYDANGIFCESSETVTVEEVEIEAVIVPPPLIDCDGNSIFIDGFGSSTGAGYFYEWTTVNGNILGSNTDIEVRVNAPAEYTLTVTYDDNGVFCEESISVIVEQVQIDVQIETPDPLDCQNTPIIIDGSNSSSGSEYSYEWTTSAGNIIGPTDQTTVEVNVAADYFLTVTYDANGILCSKTERVSVQNSMVTAVIAPSELIDCDGNPIILDGSASMPNQGPGVSYQWTTIDGNIIGPDFLPTADVDQPGEYILEVTLDNGTICTQSTSVIVEQIEVEIDIVPPPIIDCFGNSVFIDASNSSGSPNHFYEWTTNNGNIVGSNDENIVEVDQAGDYTLTITYDDGTDICTDSETVTVEKIDIEIIIETPDLIDCDGTPINLDGSNSSSGVGYSYGWTTSNGNILSAFNNDEIEVDRAGIYILTVTYDLNGVTCSKMETIEVFNDPDRPTANILPPFELTCKDSILTLNGSQSTQGSNISFEWSSNNGSFSSGTSSDTTIINQTGNYQLLVTNNDNACKDSVEVIVAGNFAQPNISFLTPDTLNCKDTLISINASNSGSSVDFGYNWIALSGNITSSSNLPTIEVNQAGVYELILTQNSNGCKDTVEIDVTLNTISPRVEVFLPEPITCGNDSIQLDGSGSDMGSDYSVAWNTIDGNFLSDPNTPTSFVNESGTYWFTVENIRNGCSDSLSVFVGIDTIAPIVDGGVPLTFGCSSDSVQLMPIVDGNTTDFLYQWGAVTGNILSNSFILNPYVGSAGTYMIFVTDSSNNCMALDTAHVLPDIDLPNVSIVASDTLGCSVDSIRLDATNSDIGTNFDFTWSTVDGNFNSNPIDYQPFITEPGTYELIIENTDNGCENLATITIFENIDTPQIFIPAPDIINCERTQVDIVSFASSATGNISFEWSTANGSIDGAVNGPTIKANSGGDYFLKVTDLDRGCESVQRVEIIENINTPDFNIDLPDTLNCRNAFVDLIPNIINPSADYIYDWSSTNGGFLGTANQAEAVTDLKGNYTLLVIDTLSKCQHLETIEVFENKNFPLVSIESQDSLDCGETRMIDASNSSQGSDFIYEWSTPNGVITVGNNTLTPTISSGGNYILEIENSINGCISIDSIEVLAENGISNIEILLAGADTLNCLNQTIIATATEGNYSYTWTNATNPLPGSWTNEVLIETPGTVQVVLRNLDTGCEGSSSIEVFGDFEKPAVTPLLPDSLTCQDSLIDLEIQVIGDLDDYLFRWYTTDGNIVSPSFGTLAEVNRTGTYFVQTTSKLNGCQDTSSIEVFESKEIPQFDAFVSNEINCKYDTAVITLDLSDIGTSSTISWSTVDGNFTSNSNPAIVTVGSTGIYEVVISDPDSGCESTREIIVSENFETPSISSITPDTLTCEITEITINAIVNNGSATQYLWTTIDGNILSGIDQSEIELDQPGIYSYQIINPESFCELNGDVEVFENTTPPVIVISNPDFLTCSTTQVQLDARQSSNGSFFTNRWTTDNNGNIVSGANGLGPIIDQPAMYYLEITNFLNGCNSIDSIKVDSLPDDIDGLMISEIPPTCENEFGVIQIEDVSGSFPPFEYSIDGGLTFSDNVLFEDLPEGNYEIIAKDSIGCTEFETIEFIVPAPIQISIIPEITLNVGETQQLEVSVDIPLDQIGSIQWFPTMNLSCSDCLDPVVTGTENTSYLVRVTTIDNCSAEAPIEVKIEGEIPEKEEGDIFFPSAFSPNDDGINDLFTGFSNSSKVAKIETLQVFDRWGNKMYEGKNGTPDNINFGWDGRYKNKRMNAGVYVFFAKVELTNGETILVEGDITLAL